jgi:hypothetical protein
VYWVLGTRARAAKIDVNDINEGGECDGMLGHGTLWTHWRFGSLRLRGWFSSSISRIHSHIHASPFGRRRTSRRGSFCEEEERDVSECDLIVKRFTTKKF